MAKQQPGQLLLYDTSANWNSLNGATQTMVILFIFFMADVIMIIHVKNIYENLCKYAQYTLLMLSFRLVILKYNLK